MNINNKLVSAKTFKIVIIGDSSTGKTNIITKYVRNQFDEISRPTIGVEFFQRDLTMKLPSGSQESITLHIWDTAGQERFRGMSSAYYRKAAGVLLVYDITNEESFSNLDRWMDEVLAFAESDAVVFLIGNKKDLIDQRRITQEQGLDYAKKHNLAFYETSALLNDDKMIEDVFTSIGTIAFEKKLKKPEQPEDSKKERKSVSDLNEHIQQKSCCQR